MRDGIRAWRDARRAARTGARTRPDTRTKPDTTTRPTKPATQVAPPEEKPVQPTQPPAQPTTRPSTAPPAHPEPTASTAPQGGRRWSEGGVGLHRWGNNLKHYADGVDEVAKPSKASTALARGFALAARKHATDAAGDLPVTSRLLSELEAVAAEAEKIAAEKEALDDRLTKLRGHAEALPKIYKIEQQGDIERHEQPRGSHRQEAAADIGRAIREN